MTKNKNYKFGHTNIKMTCRTVGYGCEVCVQWDHKPIFMGNFVHKVEANRWWGLMNREMRTFTNTYWYHKKMATSWYANFLSNHLYKTYYTFLDKAFTKYNKTFKRAVVRDMKKYRTLKRHLGTAPYGHGKSMTRYTLKAA